MWADEKYVIVYEQMALRADGIYIHIYGNMGRQVVGRWLWADEKYVIVYEQMALRADGIYIYMGTWEDRLWADDKYITRHCIFENAIVSTIKK